jgi:thymidine kinase
MLRSDHKQGNFLKLIIGPMFSGKSSHLLAEINRYKYITKNILVINNILDKKRNNTGDLKTHNEEMYPALSLNSLNELKENSDYINAKIVLIDEAQFFDDLYSFIKQELEKREEKYFIIAGLSSDYLLNPIGDILFLVPLADEIIKLTAFCNDCNDGTLASFTKRIECDQSDQSKNDKNQIIIGKSELYKPCCRYHYFN